MLKRLYKINELIKQEVSKIIEKEIGSDLGLITITNVSTTSDLRIADVWVSVYNKKNINLENSLKDIQPVIQRIINKRLHLKYVPKIILKIDKSTEYAFEIDRTLVEIKKERK